MSLFGIVVAAGAGSRFGRPKAHVELDGVALWQRSAAVLTDGGCVDVVVVGDVPDGVPGGERRRDSVANGLAVAPPEARWVIVHDAARPLASPELVRLVAQTLMDSDVDGVVPVVPVRDTLKRVEGTVVSATVDRESLVTVQTPQGFVADSLRAAHAADDGDATDDAALVERWGGRVVTVPGETHNIKLTYPDDLDLARALDR